jgi:ankyrin repeat protein
MLFDAIRSGNAEEVKALLAADPQLASSRTPEGATPVLWSIYTGHSELAPLLLGSRAPDFFEAAALGQTERVAQLLDADASQVNAHSYDGFTALGFACFFRHVGTAKLLLDRGADPGQASNNALRVAPLHSAVAANLVELVDLLLTHGADPNPREGSGSTPLHNAAGHGNPEIIARLLAGGADPTATTNDGKTPADFAVKHGHPEVVPQFEAKSNRKSTA